MRLVVSRNKLPIIVQSNFKREYDQNPLDVKNTKNWYEKFKDTDSLGDIKRSGRPISNEETIDSVRTSFERSPTKSTRRASTVVLHV